MRSLGLARKGAPWRAVGNRTDHDQADGRMRGAQVTARVALGGSTMKVLQVLTLTVLLAVALVMPRSIGPVGAAVIWVLCVVVVARSQAHGVLSFACLYLLLVGIFHLGLVAPISLGLTRVDHPPWLSSRYLSLALGLVTTAVVSFTLGVRMASRRDDLARVEAHTEPQPELFLVGLLVAVAGGGILWVGVVNLDVLSSGYGTYFERMVTGDVRFVWFGLMLFPIGLLVAAVGATRRQMMLLTALLIAALGPLFFKGFRGPVLVQAAALLAVWAHKDRRVARRVGLVVLAAALVLAPGIRVARDLDAEALSPGVGSIDPVSVLYEAGGSLYPLVVTAERIGGGAEDPWMGRSYAMAAGRIVLNVSSRRSEDRALTPSAWATLHADTWAFEHGYGIGFSGVAEPYLNFGHAGVAIFFLFLGALMHRWEGWLSRDPFRAAIGAASFGFLLWTVRNDVMDVFRAMALASVTVLVAWAAVGLRRPGLAPAISADPVQPRDTGEAQAGAGCDANA
jgi:oligosaccharide repeat unit polymerase